MIVRTLLVCSWPIPKAGIQPVYLAHQLLHPVFADGANARVCRAVDLRGVVGLCNGADLHAAEMAGGLLQPLLPAGDVRANLLRFHVVHFLRIYPGYPGCAY